MNTKTEHLGKGYCATCEKEVPDSEIIAIEYDMRSPNYYDGVSEWYHPECGRREGRWSHKELQDGEEEGRYGGGAVVH